MMHKPHTLTSQVYHSGELVIEVHLLDGLETSDDVRRSLSHCLGRRHGDRPAVLEVSLALEQKYEEKRWHDAYVIRSVCWWG